MGAKRIAVWIVFSLLFLLLQHNFLTCLQLGIICFAVEDFLPAMKATVRPAELLEQALPLPLGRSPVSSAFRPAAAVSVSIPQGSKNSLGDIFFHFSQQSIS